MTIYFLLLLIVVLLPIFYRNKYSYGINGTMNLEHRPVSYFIIISAFMICIIGLRHDNIGNDTTTYRYLYELMGRQNFSYFLNPNVNDRGYYFTTMIFYKMGINYRLFNVIYAAFNVSVISCLIYKKSKIPWLSYFVYICFEFFILDLTMIRQTTAISIVIIAILLNNGNKFMDFLKFAFILYIASLFHASAIICVPIWFMCNIKFNRKWMLSFFVLIMLAYVFRTRLVIFVNDMANMVSDKYGLGTEVGSYGIRLYLMLLVSTIYGALSKDFLLDKDNQFLWCMMCVVLIIFPMVQVGGAAMRVYYYFYVFLSVYVPNILDNVRKKNNTSAIFFIILVLYIFVGIYTFYDSLARNSFNIVPYRFFWQ